jgi:hypothetical protein
MMRWRARGNVPYRYSIVVFLVLLLMGLACAIESGRSPLPSTAQSESRNVMVLHIKLRDGFSNDTVSIKLNGKEVYRKSGVTTNLTISFADAVEIPVEESVVKLEVAVEGGQRKKKEIQVRETPFVDVWVIEGKMELRESKEEVPML